MKESPNIVLLLTHSSDFFTIDRVVEAVEKKGAIPFRLNTDKFPLIAYNPLPVRIITTIMDFDQGEELSIFFSEKINY